MVRVLLIAWLVTVIGTSVWVGLRGRRLYALARTTQEGIDRHLAESRLQELPERLAELERSQARLAEALTALQAAVAEFLVIWRAFSSVTGPLRTLRAFLTTK
ncbi:MAG TPA: hypothetical protein VFH74_08215 [Gaiellales bacterium]|nr:hypothetical protein [Gaiellales bacterium]